MPIIKRQPETNMEAEIKQFVLDEKRNVSKAERYKRAINQCCDPECSFGFGLLVHHILPISKGGKDTYDNFIVLCKKCHNANHNHKAEDIRRIELQTYKIYAERLLLGFVSKGISDDKYDMLLRSELKIRKRHKESSGCLVLDDPALREYGPIDDEDWSTMSVGGILGEDDERYKTFVPIFHKNGKNYLIIEIK